MDRITELLENAETIAVYGMSDNPSRVSHSIGMMLARTGYKVYPVNPTIETIGDMKVYPDLQSLPEPVDIVDVFRHSRFAKVVAQKAIDAGAKAIWFQLGAEDREAEEMAREAGLEVVARVCIAVEINRRGIRKKA